MAMKKSSPRGGVGGGQRRRGPAPVRGRASDPIVIQVLSFESGRDAREPAHPESCGAGHRCMSGAQLAPVPISLFLPSVAILAGRSRAVYEWPD